VVGSACAENKNNNQYENLPSGGRSFPGYRRKRSSRTWGTRRRVLFRLLPSSSVHFRLLPSVLHREKRLQLPSWNHIPAQTSGDALVEVLGRGKDIWATLGDFALPEMTLSKKTRSAQAHPFSRGRHGDSATAPKIGAGGESRGGEPRWWRKGA
jgi:hypothetical protein